MSTVEVTPVRDAEVTAVRSLLREYANALGFSLAFQGFEEELASLPGAYAPPDGTLLVARVDGRPAGCVALRRLDGEACELKRLYVSPAWRGHGLGAALAAAAVERARALGYRRIRLDTVPGMEAAQALYLRLGFREIPPYRRNPVPGARFLELDLGEVAADEA